MKRHMVRNLVVDIYTVLFWYPSATERSRSIRARASATQVWPSGDSKGFVPVARAKQPDWYQRSVRSVIQYPSTALNASSSESLETSTAKYSSLWHNKVKLILVETVNESHDRQHRIFISKI